MSLRNVRGLLRPLVVLGALALTGCGPTVSAHVVDVVVDDQGVLSRAVLSFPDHDEDIVGMDDSCGLFSGNCGSFTSVRATVVGDGTVLGARMESAGEGSARTYDLTLRRRADDPPSGLPYDLGGDVHCRVYHFTDREELSGFGHPQGCYGTSRKVFVTLTFRDGDDGR